MNDLMNHELKNDAKGALDKSTLSPPKLDPEEHRDKLAALELTKEQENELLQTLWRIMSTMVDLGWGLDTVQLFSLGEDENENVDTDSSNALMKDNVHQFNSKAESEKEK